MEAKIYTRLEAIFTAEGYNVNPAISDIKNSDQLPVVWFDFADGDIRFRRLGLINPEVLGAMPDNTFFSYCILLF